SIEPIGKAVSCVGIWIADLIHAAAHGRSSEEAAGTGGVDAISAGARAASSIADRGCDWQSGLESLHAGKLPAAKNVPSNSRLVAQPWELPNEVGGQHVPAVGDGRAVIVLH